MRGSVKRNQCTLWIDSISSMTIQVLLGIMIHDSQNLRIDSSLATQFSKVEDGRTDAFSLSSASHVVNGARDPTAFFFGYRFSPKKTFFFSRLHLRLEVEQGGLHFSTPRPPLDCHVGAPFFHAKFHPEYKLAGESGRGLRNWVRVAPGKAKNMHACSCLLSF